MQIILNKKEYEELIDYKYELIKFKDDIKNCFNFRRKFEFDEKLRINYYTLDIKSVEINISKIAELVGLSEEEIGYFEEHLVDRFKL